MITLHASTPKGRVTSRKHVIHEAIDAVLGAMDTDLLTSCGCHLAGGAAVVLRTGEHRRTGEATFLCGSWDGWRRMRAAALAAVEGPSRSDDPRGVRAVRPVTVERFGFRTTLAWNDHRVKLAVLHEPRFVVAGGVDTALGVPVLDRSASCVERLMAIVDAAGDPTVAVPAALDLATLCAGGGLPDDALRTVERLQGDDLWSAVAAAVRDRPHLEVRGAESAAVARALRTLEREMDGFRGRLGRDVLESVEAVDGRGVRPVAGTP